MPQLDLFGDPPPAGFHRRTVGAARDATKDAAEHIRPAAQGLRQAVLDVLTAWGEMTADEIAEFLDESVLSIRPRVAELASESWCRKRLGCGAMIVATGERRPNRSGVRAAVWDVVKGEG